jgi:hypothetical protein
LKGPNIEAKEHFDEPVQDKIGDSKRQSEIEEDFDGLLPSIDEVHEAERDADNDIEPLEPGATSPEADDYTFESMDECAVATWRRRGTSEGHWSDAREER